MKTGILFQGFGEQFVGMGKDLYDEHRIMQEYFEEAASCLDYNFVKLCFASAETELSYMPNAYTSIFVMGVSVYALLKEQGITPDLIAGYGIGEYAALHAAGSLSFPDGLYFINKYALALQELFDTQRMAVARIQGISTAEIKSLCVRCSKGSQLVAIASYDAHDTVHIAGTADAVACVKNMVHDTPGLKITDVDPAFGLHSPLADGVVEKIKMYLEKIDFKDLNIPLINNVDGALVKGGQSAQYSIVRQINEPLQFHHVMENFIDCELIVVVGPGTGLVTLVQSLYPDKKVFSINTVADMVAVKNFIQGDTDGNH